MHAPTIVVTSPQGAGGLRSPTQDATRQPHRPPREEATLGSRIALPAARAEISSAVKEPAERIGSRQNPRPSPSQGFLYPRLSGALPGKGPWGRSSPPRSRLQGTAIALGSPDKSGHMRPRVRSVTTAPLLPRAERGIRGEEETTPRAIIANTVGSPRKIQSNAHTSERGRACRQSMTCRARQSENEAIPVRITLNLISGHGPRRSLPSSHAYPDDGGGRPISGGLFVGSSDRRQEGGSTRTASGEYGG